MSCYSSSIARTTASPGTARTFADPSVASRRRSQRGGLDAVATTSGNWSCTPYRMHTVWRRLTGEKRGSFPVEIELVREAGGTKSEKAWRADVALLIERTPRSKGDRCTPKPEAACEARWKRHQQLCDHGRDRGARPLSRRKQIQLLKRLARRNLTPG